MKHAGMDNGGRLLAAQVKLLYKQTPAALIATSVNSAILVFILWNHVSNLALTAWFLALSAFSAYRYSVTRTYRQISQGVHDPKPWRNRALLFSGVAGVFWGSVAIFLFPLHSLPHQIFIAFVLGGMVAGSAGAYSSIREAFLIYSVPSIAPLIFRFFQQGGEMEIAMGAMVSLFLVLMIVLGIRLSNDTKVSLRLRFENVDLIASLNASKERTDKLNEELRTEISVRRKAEELIRESEEKYRTLVDNMQDGVFLVQDEKIRFVNEAFARTLGYSADEVIGQALDKFISPEDADMVSDMYRRRLAGEDAPREYEFRIKHKDGKTEMVVNLVASLTAYKGKPASTGTLKDVTERKAAMEELERAKEAAEEATRLKDKFVFLVAHDLRSPLATMCGFLEILKAEMETALDEGTDILLDKAIESGEQMIALIDELLNVSRIKAGKFTPNREFLKAHDVAFRVCADFGFLAREKGVVLENKVPEDARIYADPTLFTEVVSNLVSNAVKFCGRGDTVSMFIPEGRPTTLAVSDTGKGISSGRLDDIFSYDVKTTTPGTMGEKGTGLGLPLSREIMETHGGRLYAESAEGEGSVFYAELPYVRPMVVLAEDDKVSRMIFRKHLENLGIDVVEAENGNEALLAIGKTMPHLVITDISMPGMDGFELLEKIRANKDTVSTPVIMITSDTLMETREKAVRLGANDFITKDVMPEEFIPRVHRFVG